MKLFEALVATVARTRKFIISISLPPDWLGWAGVVER